MMNTSSGQVGVLLLQSFRVCIADAFAAEHAYSLFKSDPQAGLVVSADPSSSLLFTHDWCYTSESHALSTCFAWLGYGSFVSRSHVQSLLQQMLSGHWPSDEVALADNFFATLAEPQHSASLVLQAQEVSLSTKSGFSDGLQGRRTFI